MAYSHDAISDSENEIILTRIIIKSDIANSDQNPVMSSLDCNDNQQSNLTKEMNKDKVILYVTGNCWNGNILSSHEFPVIAGQAYRIAVLFNDHPFNGLAEIYIQTKLRSLTLNNVDLTTNNEMIFIADENDHKAQVLLRPDESQIKSIKGFMIFQMCCFSANHQTTQFVDSSKSN